MRRIIASFVAVLSLAAVPALALADSPTSHYDCAKKCDCTRSAKGTSTTSAPQEPSDWVKSIWTGA
jgi:hypothetical protein